MAYLTCKLVRPDRLLFEGPVASMVLVTYTGELGVWPGHASEICALGDGVVRMTRRAEDGGDVRKVIISGGYAEIADDTVVIIARQKAADSRDALPENDHRRAYYENKMAWCDLLLKHAPQEA